MEDRNDNFLTGKLLIAMPGMEDPRFERSVVFMCDHSPDSAMGIIVNKPVEGLAFSELLHYYKLTCGEDAPDIPVMFGGPVELNRGFFLHSSDYDGGETTRHITDDISLTASVEILHAIADGHGPKKCLLALGYAGWGEGQIESEILDNGWLHCDADASLVFGTRTSQIWQKAIGTLGVDISGLTAQSGRA